MPGSLNVQNSPLMKQGKVSVTAQDAGQNPLRCAVAVFHAVLNVSRINGGKFYVHEFLLFWSISVQVLYRFWINV